MKRKALLSVSDKTGIIKFAQELIDLDFEIISTGGTAAELKKAGIETKDISEITGFPEMLDGRVKTLHPKIHGALLALRANQEHVETCKQNQIGFIDLVAVNLYPFEETIKKENVVLGEAIENIDIGGPSMLRSAAKNYQSVTVITDTSDYDKVIKELKINGDVSLETKQLLALKVFKRTATYDSQIAGFLASSFGGDSVRSDVSRLRYGENPHQAAVYYGEPYQQLHGKELSYNNIIDIDAAQNIVVEFDDPAVAIVKHTNPCGFAIGADLEEVYEKALSGDPVSAFGSIIAVNRPVSLALAEKMSALFIEAIVAPEYEEQALHKLQEKKNLRIIVTDFTRSPLETKKTNNGYLMQARDLAVEDISQAKVVTKVKPGKTKDLEVAWKIAKHVKSNAIVLVNDNKIIGVGAGQMSRVDSVKIAIRKAKELNPELLRGCVLASDAFFPFRDGVDLAADEGVKEIIQPGGSVRDEESILACDEKGLAMCFTGVRHFKH